MPNIVLKYFVSRYLFLFLTCRQSNLLLFVMRTTKREFVQGIPDLVEGFEALPSVPRMDRRRNNENPRSLHLVMSAILFLAVGAVVADAGSAFGLPELNSTSTFPPLSKDTTNVPASQAAQERTADSDVSVEDSHLRMRRSCELVRRHMESSSNSPLPAELDRM